MSAKADKCVVCGDDFIHPELVWKVNGEPCCSPDCALTLYLPQPPSVSGEARVTPTAEIVGAQQRHYSASIPLTEVFPDGIHITGSGIYNDKR